MLAERVTQWTERWWQQGHDEGRLDGERKGLLEGKLQVARQMHADGVDIRSIARFTALDIEQIQQHVAKNDNL